jgi:hypothetical protein
LAGVSGFIGLIIVTSGPDAVAGGAIIGVVCLGAAWVIAAIPTFYWRRRILAEYGADALV